MAQQGGGRPFHRPGRGHSRGRGRGRGGRPMRERSDFKTSRVQEMREAPEEEHESEASDESDANDTVDIDHSASEDETASPRRSYSTLLQALKADRNSREPPRKKRKVDLNVVNGINHQRDSQKQDGEESASETADAEELNAALAEDREDVDEVEDIPNENDLDDEVEDSRDPFQCHLAAMEEGLLKTAISSQGQAKTTNTVVAENLRKQDRSYGSFETIPPPLRTVRDLYVKGRLEGASSKIIKSLSKDENDLAAEIANYRDIHYGCRKVENASNLRDLACLHALNHVFKTRDRVLKNNAKLSQSDEDSSLDLRDQGFSRPKVLIVVPTKQACVRFIESVVKISEPDQQENKARFWDTFSQEDDDTWENKTDDFRELFGGNNEEDFRVGLKFTRKTIKYFSGFYNSDIIFGSALGLMRTITTGGGGKDKKKVHDADFLSSIEVVIVDNAAAIQMQNFQHLEYVFTQLNQLPKDSHGCDFARVRHWYLDGNAKYLRQTILLTSHHTPELNSLVSNYTFNVAGLCKYTPLYPGSMLSLPVVLSPYTIPQTFLRFDSPTPQKDSDGRFKFFTTTILPQLLRHNAKGVLIFIPTYFDFVRLRNHLSTSNEATSLNFGSLSEYTPVRDTARTRSHFMNGRHSVLLYSERAHHHFRYKMKGVKRIVFYGVPENPVFWGEVVGYLGLNQDLSELEAGGGKGRKALVRALFSKWDVIKLERIVGTERVGRLINDRGGDTFEFV